MFSDIISLPVFTGNIHFVYILSPLFCDVDGITAVTVDDIKQFQMNKTDGTNYNKTSSC